MHRRGLIPDADPFYFYQLDYQARNLLVQRPHDDTVKVTGVLDWDAEYCIFCPKFVAMRAPFWLWVDKEADEEDKSFAHIEPTDESKRAIKAHFEESAGEEWSRYAFLPEYVIARRMF
jgi:hypothetical protein